MDWWSMARSSVISRTRKTKDSDQKTWGSRIGREGNEIAAESQGNGR